MCRSNLLNGDDIYYKMLLLAKGKVPQYGEVKFFYENGEWRYE